MRTWPWWGAVAAILIVAADASAQVVIAPPGIPIAVPNGIAFSYNRRGLSVNGFLPAPGYRSVVVPGAPFFGPVGYYPVPFVPYPGPYGATVVPSALPLYGAIDTRVNVQIIQPPIILPPAPREVDVSGVDLDVFGPEALQPGWKPDMAKKPAAKAELAKPKAAKPQKAEVAKLAPEQPAPKKQLVPAVPKPPPPKPEPADEGELLLQLGVQAFRDGEYGLAAVRFRQATAKNPGLPRAWFLLGQSHFALGKYRDAAASIEEGLKLKPDWPGDAFRPRLDLYRGIEPDLEEQKKRLDETVALQPKNAAYLFLQAYQRWFDGDRAAAVAILNQARPLAIDPTWIDAFLKAAP